jgi:hypothetical protein
MARAYGANASLLAAFETTYGSNPVGDYWKLPFRFHHPRLRTGADRQRPDRSGP